MNPFVAFLILVPLFVALFFWAVIVLMFVDGGLGAGSAVALNLVFGGLSVCLIYLLIKSSKGPLLEDKGLEHLDLESKQKLTNSTIASMYLVVLVGLGVVANIFSIRYWIGGLSLLMALSFGCSALWEFMQARKMQKHERLETSSEMINAQMAFLSNYPKTRNLLVATSILTAILTGWLFLGFNGDRFISVFDCAGLILAMVAVNFWFITKGKSSRARIKATSDH